jgi:hypothetical protein
MPRHGRIGPTFLATNFGPDGSPEIAGLIDR